MADNELIWFDADVFSEALDAACDETRKIVEQAIRSTMAKLRKRTHSKLSFDIRQKWNIAKKDLDGKLKIKASKGGNTYETFEMTIKGTSLSLSYFGAKQFSGNRVTTRKKSVVNKRRSKFQGVEVKILKGKKKKQLTNAFIGASSSGHVMVLRRKGKGRYPIEAKAVISAASMFSDSEFYDRFTDQTMDDLEQLFSHELEWRLGNAGLI